MSKNKKQINQKFYKVLQPFHKQFTQKTVTRLLISIARRKTALTNRSKKAGVKCDVTTDQLKKLFLDNYGKECPYCSTILVLSNIQVDHITAISKGGASTIKNLRLLCRRCNKIKGSFSEENLFKLFKWLDTMPEDFKKSLLGRLAGGVNYR